MKKTISVHNRECGSCSICEMICSLTKTGECSPVKSRIRLFRGEMLETPVLCRQCEVMFCAAVCKESAIYKDPETGVVLVNNEACTGCRSCVAACPFGAVGFDTDTRRALICDQCGGDPQCVAWCPRGALLFTESTPENAESRSLHSQTMFSIRREILRRIGKPDAKDG